MATPPNNMPVMGTPEFREFVQTPEWMNYRHEQALEDNEVWDEHKKEMDTRDGEIARGEVTVLGPYPEPPRDPFLRYGSMFVRDFRVRLAPDDSLRMDYEESISGKAETELRAEDARAFKILNETFKDMARTALAQS